MFTLTTPRLLLRDLRLEDWEAVHRLHADSDVQRYMLPGQGTERYTRRFVQVSIEHAAQAVRTFFGLALIRREDGALIGTCVLGATGIRRQGARVGWTLGKSYWGQGYGTETAKALVDYAFGTLGITQIYGECFTGNIGSRRVMEKAGLTLRPRSLWAEYAAGLRYGDLRPMLIYALDHRAWKPSGVLLPDSGKPSSARLSDSGKASPDQVQ
ncbi:MAG: GNAT family N-acetyltransferase [Capsulimonas sp.]|uniref:GNAT family N-acetyltransferase n=1 Tax=Capsulimonas sp. TaxID=2494211 RepID=UPI003265239C